MRARELLAHAVDHPPVVHAGRREGDRADPRRHRAAGRARPIADDERVARGIALAAVARQVLVDLDLQGRRDHPLRPDARQLIERRPDQRLRRCIRLRSDKLQHRWRTFLPGWHRGLGVDCSTSPEGYVASLSHPQLSTIAPWPLLFIKHEMAGRLAFWAGLPLGAIAVGTVAYAINKHSTLGPFDCSSARRRGPLVKRAPLLSVPGDRPRAPVNRQAPRSA